ncbi:hypothetical protein [Nannocystis bainbridge]|uniref:Uncharacterized protein n=1 Tax=Nannocystis bainbridge TaxID=2995303 RepID=A0ABT5DWC7_9BACT|nr:hypothetical protein [Nannocystis bainbridge]MDC0717938.1 hypothetical protein [Nannocystis bainbridge]
MFRKILMLCPVLAFALPLVAAGTSMARPLSIPAQPAEWCWGGNDCGDFDDDLVLAVCVQTQIFVQTGQDNRAYECDTLTGPTCLASCAAAGDAGETCRSHCDGDGALFCAPGDLKARWGGWDDDDDDDDNHHQDQDDMIFINTETCLELNLDQR